MYFVAVSNLIQPITGLEEIIIRKRGIDRFIRNIQSGLLSEFQS